MTATSENLEEFVKFKIGEQEFCIEMSATRELRSWVPTTTLPNASANVIGIINLRDKILPIVNLAARLGLPSATQNDRKVVIVVQTSDNQFGLLVDAVSDIISASPSEIHPVPKLTEDGVEELFKQVIVQGNDIICQIILDQLLPVIEDNVSLTDDQLLSVIEDNVSLTDEQLYVPAMKKFF